MYHGMYIRLTFDGMDIEVSDGCDYDSLIIFNINEEGFGDVTAILCGNHTPRDIISKGNVIRLFFNSNVFNPKKGFSVTYTTTSSPELCPSGMLECRNRNCISRSLKCNGRDECGDGTDEEKCGLPAGVSDCGNPGINPLTGMDRIVGGHEAIPGSWPWMAELQSNLVEPNGHECGGSLINTQWVLTAAHSFQIDRQANRWRVHLGTHNKYIMQPDEQVRYVERIIIYDDIPPEKFEADGEYEFEHDVALMKLNAPVNITSHVRPVCLPPDGKELELLTACFVTGWGSTRGTGSSDCLKQAYHPIQADKHCEQYVGEFFNPPTMICASTLAPLNGACHGDSGGPLVCKMDKKWYIFGITSYGTDSNMNEGICGLKPPSVFSKVSAKISWIVKMINKYT